MRKALWVVRDKITTPEAIDDLLEDSATRGIFDLVVQVRGRGDAYYTSTLEPRAEQLTAPFDPLDRLIRYGGSVGARIHAWANVFFIWSHPDRAMPQDPRHIVNRHPEWLLRPDGVSAHDPAGGKDFEGIYSDPASVAAREHTLAVYEEIVTRYPVVGLHYDYVRYPQVTYASSPEDHAHVTTLVRESAARIRRIRASAIISAAVFPDPTVARERVLQRWPEWAEEGLVDLLCPMAYRRDSKEVARLLGLARAAAPKTELWGGLMGYAGETETLGEQVRGARDAGCEGVILFAYDPAQRDLLDVFASA
ncbi:MAG TPA: family 10 glycosylhydrolase [Candidatus Limnocylindrales bacterium]|nr:family 10 glycosylhydrolase [Candidatus Limnocylindrales bacterium]